MLLSENDFQNLTSKIKNYSGIEITHDKSYLLESRLSPLTKERGFNSLGELVLYMQNNNDESLLIEIIEAMTTNESSFFRDFKSFAYLRDNILPKITSLPDKNKFRIWSAGSSTGQEAYSIAIALLESPIFSDKIFEILATDIDHNVIGKAQKGLYSEFEVGRGLPSNLLFKYFDQEGDKWQAKSILKQLIKFEKFNLLDNPSNFGSFDIIFCRNVLIYFDELTTEKVLTNISKVMKPNAYLFTGGTESFININVPLIPIEGLANIFKLKNS